MKLDLSIIIPLLNEEECIPKLEAELQEVLELLPGNNEVLFVDDGSTDRSFELLQGVVERRTWARVVKLKRNFGQTQAMAAGFDAARGETLVCMDADLQNDPKDIPILIEKLEEGYDIVSGWRKHRQDKFLSRRLPSVCANWLLGKVLGVKIHDYGCSLKAYDARVVKSLHLYSDMHRFLPALASKCGARVTEIPVNHRPRLFGQSKYGLSRVFKVVFDMTVIKLIVDFSNRPAHYFGIWGTVFLLGALWVTPFFVINMVMSFREESIVLPSIIVLMFTTSVYFYVLGMLGDLIVQVSKHDATEYARSTAVEVS